MILGILQARLSSTRLPGKVLKPLLGKPMLWRQLERVSRAQSIDKLIVATSDQPEDQELEQLCKGLGVGYYRGSLEDVLDRFYQSALMERPDHVVRLTGDCPLADPVIIDQVISHHLVGGFDYTSNTVEPSFPDGLDVEIMRFSSLEQAWREASLLSDREHVTSFIWTKPDRFKIGSVTNREDLSHLRWTVDELEDFEFVSRIYEGLYPTNARFGFDDIMRLLEEKPDLQKINSGFERNAGYRKSISKDKCGVDR